VPADRHVQPLQQRHRIRTAQEQRASRPQDAPDLAQQRQRVTRQMLDDVE
jgi:hypothetical protein